MELLRVEERDLSEYKKEMQKAFQEGAIEINNENIEILPESDIDESLNKEGSAAYKAVVDEELVGGAIVVIDKKSQCNSLEFLFVKCGCQSRGIGQKIWKAIESFYPETKEWETCTPYFEKRNIHFYINCLGFHAVEFFNPHHKDSSIPDDMIGGDYFFRFTKQM